MRNRGREDRGVREGGRQKKGGERTIYIRGLGSTEIVRACSSRKFGHFRCSEVHSKGILGDISSILS